MPLRHKTNFKKKLKSGVTVGAWITIGNPNVAEIMANSGFDWLAIDMEHSTIGLETAQALIQVIQSAGVAALVRVEENNPNVIKRIMDAGADGVIVPMVNNKAEALKAVRAVKYPPVGTRGVGLARAQGYGMAFEEYKRWVNKESVVIIQIEHIEAVRNLEEILSIEDVDATLVGPYDLSGSLGIPGQFDHKNVKGAIERYVRVCKQLKKTSGFHVIAPDAKLVKEKIKQGFQFIGFSIDELFLGRKIESELRELKRK